jgi:transposase InsO family protein
VSPTTRSRSLSSLSLGQQLRHRAAEQVTERNRLVSCDWGIVNVKSRKGNTVFALYLDAHTGVVFARCAPSRGEAADALDAHCQTWGTPSELIHDNAVEFLRGTFQMRCRERGIKQSPSPPNAPNYNPSERRVDVVVGGARSLLYISGLDPQLFWDDAVEHRVQPQLVVALPGRPMPWGAFTRKTTRRCLH